jgi:hypothetical protein
VLLASGGDPAHAAEALSSASRPEALAALRTAAELGADAAHASAMARVALAARGALPLADLAALRDAALASPPLLGAVAAALRSAPPELRREWLLAALAAAAGAKHARGMLTAAARLAAAWHAPTDALCLEAMPHGEDALADALPATLPALLAGPGWAPAVLPAAQHLLAIVHGARDRADVGGARLAAATLRGMKRLLPPDEAADMLCAAADDAI